MPNVEGTSGFIDFAIDNYNKPEIGIELSLKYGWSHEEIVYDFLKLLDKKNPFNISISFNMIFRQGRLVKGGYLRNLEKRMNEAISEAENRLGNEEFGKSRELFFIVTEVDKDDNKHHWHYDKRKTRFTEGLPVITHTST